MELRQRSQIALDGRFDFRLHNLGYRGCSSYEYRHPHSPLDISVRDGTISTILGAYLDRTKHQKQTPVKACAPN